MNNEIEFLFEELMKIANGNKNYCSFYRKECNLLLHYYREINNQNYDLKQENENLKDYLKIMEKAKDNNLNRFLDYKSRNEKAIEYIDKYCIDDEFFINLTLKEKRIYDIKDILEGREINE